MLIFCSKIRLLDFWDCSANFELDYHVSMAVWFFVLVVAVPLYFIYRDIRRTLRRMQIFPHINPRRPRSKQIYLDHARRIFAQNPETAAYVFGHTHDAFLVEEDGRAIINTGTWLKIFRRVTVRSGLFRESII